MDLHRGRLIDHIQLVVQDIAASKRFYKAVFEVLDIPVGGEADDHLWADELFISTRDSKAAQGQLLDPDGNNIEVVFHGAARKSAASVTVSLLNA
jgi:catechol 2,3-dioxygenase-like lactoylglutathione lyase family enzyme